jgi:phthiocerol/phenolphthiocerol synthesis type-I polyketide synthase D
VSSVGLSSDRRGIIAEALRKIDDLSARLEVAERGDTEPIAVVGMGCRLPGGVNTPAEYWELLQEGRSGVVRVPAERWDADAYYSADHTVPGTICSRDGGFLTSWQPDEFDAEFFGISPREAAGMDPQHRLVLEVAWEALENAGITAQAIRGTRTSVFVGLTTYDYILGLAGRLRPEDIDPHIPFGNASNFVAGRLAYFLGVHGPAVGIDTACSSSLVTVHLACQSLRRGESDQALAAGVNLILTPENSIACSRWGMLAPDGRCKTFDAGADGYVRSEGAGVVVLKRLSDALRDRDPVWAVVRGSAVNQDGPSSGQTVPNGPAQQAVLRQALAAARLTPGDIDYIEAHGTGTALGDPIELDALSQVFAERDGAAPLVLGSVKTNLGHLESAAGIAGFIKTVLSVRHGHIPQHLNFHRLTPHASNGASRFTIAAQPMPWPAVGRARRAGVSSFGVSGTNAHIVVEQAPTAEPVAPQPEPVIKTLIISGKTPARIAATASMLAQWMTSEGANVPLVDVAHTLNHHRTRYKTIATVCARDRAQAVTGLQALAAGELAPGVVAPSDGPNGTRRVFVYSGQGSQWAGMGRELLADEPAFAAAVAGLEPVFLEHVGFSLQQLLADGEPVTGDTRVQPVIMGLQLALTQLWRSYGVHPDAVIGHSMGEVTAAVISGALTVADGLRVIATRSRLMSRLAAQGAVALLELDADATAALITDFPGVSAAGYLSPRHTVIAGPPDPVDAVIAAVTAQGRFARRVNMEVASHTALMDPILPELGSALADLTPELPTIPFFSTVIEATTAPRLNAEYWVNNVRQPVRFSHAVAEAGRNHGVFVELGPHTTLTHAVTDTLQQASPADPFFVTSTMKRGEDEAVYFHMQLAAVGVTTQSDDGGRLADIPPSPWLHSRYWVETPSVPQRSPDVHPLLGVHVELPSGRDHVWQAEVRVDLMPWLFDHTVHGQAVMPAAGFAEMVLAAGCAALGLSVETVEVNELEVEQTLALDRETRITTQLAQSNEGIRVEIYASSAGGNWRRYASASINVTHQDRPSGRVEARPAGSSEAEIEMPAETADHPGYHIHPVMLDAALRRLAATVHAESPEDSAEIAFVPVSLATMRVFGQVGRRARCYTELMSRENESDTHIGRITLMDDMGAPTAELTGICLRRTDRRTVSLPLEHKVFETIWAENSMPEIGRGISAAAGSWLLLADDDPETMSLVAEFTIQLSSPTRRVISEVLSDESAVLEAFAQTAADPEHPPVGVIVFVGRRSFDGTDSDGSLRRARELIWSISVAARAAVNGWQQKSQRLWLVTRNGLTVTGDERGDPAIGALKGIIRTWRFPGELARVLADEPDLWATLVDLDEADGLENVVAALMRELALPARDDVIAWRQQRRYVERLTRATLDTREHDAAVRADSYVVTGALGGLGMVVARWLVDSGAGRLILNGRTDPSNAQRRDLAALSARTEIAFVRGDIASPGVAERLVSAAEETGRPLRGVIHAAGVLDDGLVAALSRSGLERVWAAKALGALRLHEATVNRELDWWVGFSSMAAVLGLPGQVAYATANAWLDALVAWRRASGLPATAINWGQWSDVGIGRSVTLSVLDPITPAEGIEALESLLSGKVTRVGVARLRLDRAVAATPEFRELGYLERVIDEFDSMSIDDSSTTGDGDRSTPSVRDWSQMSTEDLCAELQIELRAILSRELRTPASAVDVNQPFPELGLDSMMAMTVLRETQQLVATDLSANMLFNHPTISSLSAYLAEMLAPQQLPQDDDADRTMDAASSVLDELFDNVESASAGIESGL